MSLPAASTIAEYLPRIIPAGWRMVEQRADGCAYSHFSEPWTVILSVENHPEPDGSGDRLWLHCSTARRDRLPKWRELVDVRDWFLGRDTTAYQVIPSRAEYINIHPNCLHLWVPVGRRLTPDFTCGSGSL